jgi:hypothetical protein
VDRLPVLAVVRAAYQFTFANLGAIIGVIWLPMAAVTVTGFFAEQRFYAAIETAIAVHGTPDGSAMLLFLGYAVLFLLFHAMMMVGVARLALGAKPAGRFPIGFGGAEWRLFRAWFGLMLFLLVPLLVFSMATMALAPGDPATASAAQLGRLSLIFLLMTAALVFVGLRFAFLLPGLAAGEGGTEKLLARAWTLSAGHFWRIFAIVMLCLLPVYFGGAVLQSLGELTLQAEPATPGDLTAMLARTRAALPLAKGLQFLMAPFIIGLMASASVIAGRDLGRTDIRA